MKMVDDAAALNFKYAMIDEGWELWEGNKWERIKEIAAKIRPIRQIRIPKSKIFLFFVAWST